MPPPQPSRNEAIDWLRGAVMILMALDHTRMFLGTVGRPPHRPARALFHALGDAFLRARVRAAGRHRRLPARPAPRLDARAVALPAHAWPLARLPRGHRRSRRPGSCTSGPTILVLQVIWAIGASMVVLAGLVWLPRAAIAAFAVALIAGHNLLDAVQADQLGRCDGSGCCCTRRAGSSRSPARTGSSSTR